MTHEHPSNHENGTVNHDQARHDIGAIAMHETEQKPALITEISRERQAAFVEKDPHATYYLFCGDDRNPTEENSAALGHDTEVASPELSISYYGGLYGAARVLATTIAMQYGPSALASYGTSFNDFAEDLGNRISASNNVVPGIHSAHSNEGNPVALAETSDKGVGCAYAANVQVVTELNASEPLIELGRAEQPRLLGDDHLLEPIAAANQAVDTQFSDNGTQSFNLNRNDMKKVGAPVAILEGSHATITDGVVVVINFFSDKIRNARRANETHVPFYNNDVTQMAEMLIKANPDLDLNPRTLLAVMDQDIRATREALAAGEGKHAADLPIERYGDPEAAIAYLESIK